MEGPSTAGGGTGGDDRDPERDHGDPGDDHGDPGSDEGGADAEEEPIPAVGRYYDLAIDWLERDKLDDHRRYLAADPGAVVLDLGGATGPMLPYFEAQVGARPETGTDGEAGSEGEGGRSDEVDATDGLAVHVVDPNRHYRAWAEGKADEYDVELVVEEGRAESIPYGDDTFDTVVTSQVFCTVEDVAAGLAEVERVLRPDGEFRFLEHVHSGGIEGAFESALTPAWKRVADGCHLNRHTAERIRESDLTVVETERFTVGLYPPRTYVRGTAVPPG